MHSNVTFSLCQIFTHEPVELHYTILIALAHPVTIACARVKPAADVNHIL